jgi:signal transduction histidine kinase
VGRWIGALLDDVRRLRRSSPIVRYVLALCLIAVAIGLTAVLTESIARAPSALLFSAVLVVAWVAGLGPAILAALCAGLALVYLQEPMHAWHLTGRERFWITVFLGTVLAMAALTAWIRRLEDERGRLLARERDARTEAEAASSAKDEFLTIVSHEMKTPLTAILGWIEVVRRPDTTAADLQRAADTIARNARLQSKLIDDLLDVSRARAGKLGVSLTVIDLAEVLRHVVRSGTLRAREAGIELSSGIEAGMQVWGDRARLEQVFGNLLSNAIKFTPIGGVVTVSASRAAGQARVIVTDSGQGIDAEHLEHVFDRFWQDSAAARPREGLGLGLAIVKHILDEHGGHVRAESAGRGRGASFVVDLPLA